MLLTLCSQVLISGCDSHNEFRYVLDTVKENKDNLQLNENIRNYHGLSRFYKWSKIAEAMSAESDDISLLKKLRRGVSSYSPHSDGQIGATIFDAIAVLEWFDLLFPIDFFNLFADFRTFCSDW